MLVEYLVIIKREKSACDTVDKFLTFVQFDSRFKVVETSAQLDGKPVCDLSVTTGDVPAKAQRYFRLILTWDHNPQDEPKELKRFVELLGFVRVAVAQLGGELEQLRNEVSNFYAKQAYPYIQEVENTMRQLITTFMMVNVGLNWAEGALPPQVDEAVRVSKKREGGGQSNDKENLHLLYRLDFIHLGNFLFDAYPQKQVTELYKLLTTAKEISLKDLEPHTPRSNWQRYFADIVECDEQFLRKRWEELYLLRCKVAHNAIMVEQDLQRIKELVGEVLPVLQSAIGRLPEVTVPETEAEGIAESAASTVSATVGEFILKWQQLERTILDRLPPGTRMLPFGDEMLRRGLLSQESVWSYNQVRQIRNQVVHARSATIDESQIQATTSEIDAIVDWIENESFVSRLRAMGAQERQEIVEEMLNEAHFDILNSDEVIDTMAITNATEFDVDQIDITGIDFKEGDDTSCTVRFTFEAHGTHEDENRMFSGDTVVGSGVAEIDPSGQLSFEEISAEVESPDEEDEFDPGDVPFDV
jgi:hypothetical protein